jgi:N-acetylglucosamine-6-sulfatase
VDRICLAFLALLLFSFCAGEEPEPERPNIIFILMDDVRWDDLGVSGHPWARTLNIDRIAREGALFENAFATTPLCSPNRATLLTGQYAHTHGIVDNVDRSELSHRLRTFPLILQEQGYETAFIGKWHMGVDPTRRPGFDYWVSIPGQGRYFDPEINDNGEAKTLEGYVTDIFSDHAVQFVQQSRQKPFLLYLSHKAVHPNVFQFADSSVEPVAADGGFNAAAPRHKDLYAGDSVPRRPNAQSYAEDKPALRRPIPGLPPLGPGTGTDDETVRNRLRLLTAADEGIGRILDALEQTGQLDDTVVVFTSDHGYFYGEHGLDRERRLAYEETIRVPLFVRYPPLIKAGTKVAEFALSVDIGPTLLELGAAPPLESAHGRSLAPLLKGKVPEWRKSFLIEYFSDTVMPRLVTMGYQAVRTDRWKYIHYTELENMDELYDLTADPYEVSNLFGKPEGQPVLPELKEELARLLQETGGQLQ